MTYEPRAYEEIVRDLLTTLTQGTVGETVIAPAGDTPVLLRNRPVQRISHLQGKVAGKRRKVVDGKVVLEDAQLPYKFTPAEFELIASTGDENNKDSIRFREGAKRPIPGTPLSVNYYPVQLGPTPLTDLNVGSVIRTLIETIAYELSLTYLHLQHIYESAYVETAEGASLDKVAALVGVRRLPAGYPIVTLRFSRRADASTQVTVPTNTAVTTAAGDRYLTLAPLTLEPGEMTRDVQAQGDTPGTRLVDANQLNRLEVLIGGIAEVTNPAPARALTSPETDEELRRRLVVGLRGVARGTLDALKFHLLSINGVKNVNVIELPNGVPGEIRLEIAYNNDSPEVQAQVTRTIEEIRPAGIRVLHARAQAKRVSARIALTLAGAAMRGQQLAALQAAIENELADYLNKLPPGGKARRAQMARIVLSDARVADATITLLPEGEAETDELALEANTILEVVRPFTFPPPTFEEAPGAAPALISTVSIALPIHLAAGVTLAQASSAINIALDSYLASRRPDQPLTVDGLAAAIRDDTRFALARADALVTVEGGGRFLQLTDGVGSYGPAINETLQKGTVAIEPREGGV